MNQNHPAQTSVTPPVAEKHAHVLELHGDRRVDNYFWLRDRDYPQVIAHLEAENAYTSATMQHTEALQKKLYDQMLDRIKETDLSVPYRKDDYTGLTRSSKPRTFKSGM